MTDLVKTAHVGSGNVEIVLLGEKKILKPTYRAAQGLSDEFGGLSDIVQRVVKLDISVISSVVEWGLGLTAVGRQGLEEKVYQSGAANLVSPCIKYISVLANGGQPVVPANTEDKDNPNEVTG